MKLKSRAEIVVLSVFTVALIAATFAVLSPVADADDTATVTLSNEGGNVSFTYRIDDETESHTYSSPFKVYMGSKLTVTASADNGYRFIKWKDEVTDAERSVDQVTAAISWTAVAEYVDPTITVTGATDMSGIWTSKYNATGTVISIEHPLITATTTVQWYKGGETYATGTNINIKDVCTEDAYHAVIVLTDAFGNITSDDITVTITKRQVTMMSAYDTKQYDRKPLENHNVTVKGDGFADGEGVTYDFTGTQTVVGTSQNTFNYTLNIGTKAGNYDIASIYGDLVVTERSVSVPDELYYPETGSVITFDIPTSEWYSIEDKERKGTSVGTYTYRLTLEDYCVWQSSDFNGDYHVYITEVKKEHVNEDGIVDVAITGDKGIRGDLTLAVTDTKDVSNIESKFKLDGKAQYLYEIRFMNGATEVQQEEKLTVAILIPDNVNRNSFSLYHAHGDTCSKVDYRIEGDYVIATVEDLADFVFVTSDNSGAVQTALYFVIGIICAIAVLMLAAFFLIKRKKTV